MGQLGQSKNKLKGAIVIIVSLMIVSCNNTNQNNNDVTITNPTPTIEKKNPTPDFNSDSAYAFTQAQVDFGPRVPGSQAHAKCADYLAAKFKSYGMDVILQKGTIQTFDKKQFTLKNIIASFNPEAQSRIMICSHWDCRPWADEDTKDRDKPFDSANDGASGVAVGMEIARQISISKPNIGVDIICFDLEDYGTSGDNESWCLGSQYWAKNLHRPNYYANFGVLLDMVAGENAIFPKESNSVQYASSIVDKVWNTANNLGYGNYFVPQTKGFVGVDDHIYVNEAGIPCIDIIEYNQSTGGFGDYHHTHKDNMSIINKNTLKAVGQTLLEVIYSEQ